MMYTCYACSCHSPYWSSRQLECTPSYYQLNRGHVSFLKKLHHKIMINWFNMSDLLDAEVNTLGGKLVI